MGVLHIILKVGHPKIISTQISEQKILMWFLSHLVSLSELEIKDTTITAKSASYLDLHLSVDTIGRVYTKLTKIILQKYYGHHHELFYWYQVSVSQIIVDIFPIVLLLDLAVMVVSLISSSLRETRCRLSLITLLFKDRTLSIQQKLK
jgi:hypothetical protein